MLNTLIRRHRLQRRLTRQLRKAGVRIDSLRIADTGGGPRHRLVLRKSGGRLDIGVNHHAMFSKPGLADTLRHRAGAIIEPFMGSSLHEAIGDISDGEESRGGIISFSSSDPDAILVPDAIFHASQGYASLRAASASWVTGWQARKETIVWRGSTTGVGTISNAEMNPADASLLPRTRMCLMLRGSPGVDARIVGIAQSDDLEGDRSRLDHAGVLGNQIDPMTWLARKFAIDIDGNTNAWSNLFTRLLAGCCVIKIESPHGYRQWYYDALDPWRHFVPVNADFSDLHEKIDWCRAHDSRCEEIAEAGRAFALQREFASEMKAAVRTLERRLAGKGVGA